ncbi:hypothetical protein BH18THE2_BH18THE2_17440 [soil metagenome]
MSVIYTIVIVTSSRPTNFLLSIRAHILSNDKKHKEEFTLFKFFIPIISYSFLLKSEVAGMTLHFSINDATFTTCSAGLIVIYCRV